MRIKVVALTPDDFDAWAENQQEPAADPRQGRRRPPRARRLFAGQLCSSLPPHQRRERRARSARTPADRRTPKLQVVGRRAEPHPLDEPHHVRRRDVRPLHGPPTECHGTRRVSGPTDRRGRSASASTAPTLEAWLRNRPGDEADGPGDAEPESRGMPNLNLTEDQIDQLVAYLQTLK